MSWYSAVTGRDRAKRALQQTQGAAAAYDSADAADPYGRQGLVGQENNLMGEQRDYGARGEGDYLNRAENFNAQDSVNNFAKGAYGSISRALTQNLGNLRDESVGAGRLDTGFYTEDQGKVLSTATGQLSDAIAQGSLQAAGLQQRNDEGLGQFGQNATNNYGDLLTARRGEVEQDYRDAQDRQRKRKGGIGAALGTGLGYLAGGPVGGYIGGAIGGSIFS